MICHYWYVLDNGYKFEPEVCKGCHDITKIAFELQNIAILNIQGVDYRCGIWNITKSDAINRSNNSKLDDKCSLWTLTLVEIIGLLKWLKKEHLDEHTVETFILVLMVDGAEIRGKSLTSEKVLIADIIAQNINTLASISMVLSVEHH